MLVYIRRMPVLIIIAALFVLAILILLIYRFIKQRSFRKAVREQKAALATLFSASYIEKKASYLVRYVRKGGNEGLLRAAGLNTIWIAKYRRRPSRAVLKFILEFFLEEGLFSLLQASLKRPGLLRHVLATIREHGLRMLALSCKGEEFPGNHPVFAEFMEEVWELAGDPEWNVRYFAVKILLGNDLKRSSRALIDMLEDPHPLIRKTIISQISEFDNFYLRLENILLRDAVFEVRQAAWERIQTKFSDRYEIAYADLNPVEAGHFLDFLDPRRSDHINIAMQFLAGENLELRHPAAVLLEESGWLLQMLNEANLNDEEDFRRRLRLLTAAVQVQVSSFLLHTDNSPGSIFLALKLLTTTGDRMYVSYLAERALNGSFEERIWQQAVILINARPTDNAILLLLKELRRYSNDERRIAFLLDYLRVYDDRRVGDLLLSFLVDPAFPARKNLVEAISRLNMSAVLTILKSILKAGRDRYPHIVRITALRIIASYRLPYLLQTILEQLPTLNLEEAREFTLLLKDYAGQEFSQRVDVLIKQYDSKIRAALIASLPYEEKMRILQDIVQALEDTDPDVRVAAVSALVELKQQGYVKLLKDPVARVREAASSAMGVYGGKKALKILAAIIDDEHETEAVKAATIRGIAGSPEPAGVKILVNVLSRFEAGQPLYDVACAAIGHNINKERIKLIIEEMKEADKDLREKLVNIFVTLKEAAETFLRELLEEDPASLRPYIIEIFEKTGYVDLMIRHLGRRRSAVRRDAARFLIQLDSVSGYRGLVQAIRDPDKEIRIMVTKSLDRGGDGQAMLQKLQTDPDRRVRQYAAWALERFAARKIDDGGG